MNGKEIRYEAPEQEMKIIQEEALAMYDANRKYTYDEVQYWLTDNRRWELIDGIPLLMASPAIDHQLISTTLTLLFGNYLKGKECQLILPVDTVLSYGEGSDTYVIPDLVVLCNRNKVKKGRIFGAPDLIIEILSPSTSSRDKIEKRLKYQEAGVKEYWIVDLKNETIEVILATADKDFNNTFYGKGDSIKVSIFTNLEINVADVFANPWLS